MYCHHCVDQRTDQTQDRATACISCVCKKRLETKPMYGNIYPAWFSQFFKAFFSTRVTTTCWCTSWTKRLISDN